jgi:hypothetical protein
MHAVYLPFTAAERTKVLFGQTPYQPREFD